MMKARLRLPLESDDPVRLRAKPDRRRRLDRRLVLRGGRRASDDQQALAPGHDSGTLTNPEACLFATRRRQVTCMEWPSGAAVGDAVIVRQDPSSGSRFVVHGSHGRQLACATYAEAEAQAASYAEPVRANVWYVEGGRLQLVCSFRDRDHLRQETLAQDPQE